MVGFRVGFRSGLHLNLRLPGQNLELNHRVRLGGEGPKTLRLTLPEPCMGSVIHVVDPEGDSAFVVVADCPVDTDHLEVLPFARGVGHGLQLLAPEEDQAAGAG